MRRHWPIAAVIALAAVLRLHGLAAQSIWFDEALTMWLAKLPYPELIGKVRYFEQIPPLIHVVTGWFIAVFGDSEVVVRLPVALAGIGAVWGIYAVARRVDGERAALIAALLLAVCPYAIDYSQEARPYSFVLLLSLLSTHAFLVMLDEPKRGRIYYVIVTALLLYAHPFGAIVPAGHLLAWIVARWTRRTALGWLPWFATLGAVGVLFLPWVPILLSAMRQTSGGFWIPALHFEDVSLAYWIYCNAIPALMVVLIAAVVGIVVARKKLGVLAIALLATLPVVVPIVVSIVLDRPMFSPRYGIAAVGGMFVLAAIGLSAMPGVVRAVVLAVLIGGMIYGPGFAPEGVGFNLQKPPWREAGLDMRARMRPGDLVLYTPGFTKIHFDYYVRRDDVRQVPFKEETYPNVTDDHFWLIVSKPTRPTFEMLASGQWLVVSQRVYGEMLVLELRHS